MSPESMQPDLQSSLICDDVRQERNGKFILIGLFDAIVMPKYPATIPRLCIVNRWCCGVGQFVQRSRFLSPDQQHCIAESKPVNLTLNDDTATATCVEFFLNIRFEAVGTYWVEILLDDRLRLRYPLRAGQVQPKPTDPPASPSPSE